MVSIRAARILGIAEPAVTPRRRLARGQWSVPQCRPVQRHQVATAWVIRRVPQPAGPVAAGSRFEPAAGAQCSTLPGAWTLLPHGLAGQAQALGDHGSARWHPPARWSRGGRPYPTAWRPRGFAPVGRTRPMFPRLPIKLDDCTHHGIGSGAELYVVEGDSAAGAVSRMRNAAYQAVLPMQGKPLNTVRATAQRVVANPWFAALTDALGTGLGDAFEIKALRYDRVILLMDPDADGIHCGALVTLFFYRWMRPAARRRSRGHGAGTAGDFRGRVGRASPARRAPRSLRTGTAGRCRATEDAGRQAGRHAALSRARRDRSARPRGDLPRSRDPHPAAGRRGGRASRNRRVRRRTPRSASARLTDPARSGWATDAWGR